MNPGGSLFCISHMLFAKKLSTPVLCLKARKFSCEVLLHPKFDTFPTSVFLWLAVRNEDRESDAMLAEKWIKYAALMSFSSI